MREGLTRFWSPQLIAIYMIALTLLRATLMHGESLCLASVCHGLYFCHFDRGFQHSGRLRWPDFNGARLFLRHSSLWCCLAQHPCWDFSLACHAVGFTLYRSPGIFYWNHHDSRQGICPGDPYHGCRLDCL